MSATIREEDIRPAAIFDRYLELSRLDAERFFADRSRFVFVPCPGCAADRPRKAFDKSGFCFVDCQACGTLYASPRPDRSSLDAFYGDSESATYWAETFFPASAEPRREKMFVPRVERIFELMRARGAALQTVIDVGAGYGIFLEELKRQAPSVACMAVEPGRKLAEICRSKGFETLEAPVEDAGALAGRGDLVVCFEVLEHVFSALEFVSAVAALAKPGGWIVVTTLCADGIDIQTLRGRSKSVSPPHHLNFLSVAGLENLFNRCGLHDVEVLTPGRLDVDILRNAWRADPAALDGHRFLETLLAHRDASVHQAFQEFLAASRLSSHGWVVGRKRA
jgi:SAM-dependent methyltransferase